MPKLVARVRTLAEYNELLRQGSHWAGDPTLVHDYTSQSSSEFAKRWHRERGNNSRHSGAAAQKMDRLALNAARRQFQATNNTAVSRSLSAHQWLALASLSFFCVLLSGITFGWYGLLPTHSGCLALTCSRRSCSCLLRATVTCDRASLQQILRDEGVYECGGGDNEMRKNSPYERNRNGRVDVGHATRRAVRALCAREIDAARLSCAVVIIIVHVPGGTGGEAVVTAFVNSWA